MKVRNPRTGLYDYEMNELNTQDVYLLYQQLKSSQSEWHEKGIDYRVQVLEEWKQQLIKHKTALTNALSIDTGRYKETVLEVDLCIQSISRWCDIAANLLKPADIRQTAIPFIEWQPDAVPYHVAGVISPWNFPLLLSLIDTIPALLAGSAIMVKPSEITPRFIAVMQQIIAHSGYLQHVLAYVQGGADTGAAMVQTCDVICFTGSTATGQKINIAAAPRMIPVYLEMGGKDAAIILESANIEQAAASVLWGSTANSGQSCLSIERVYVNERIANGFIKFLKEKAAKVKLNDTAIDQGDKGPLIFEKQAMIVNEHLSDALQKGAVLEYGDAQCQLINGGWYCRPTILTGVNHDMKIMTEESFGPLIPVMTFRDTAEAIKLANNSMYGLSGAVFAGTAEEAIAVAKKLEAGAISINDCALTAMMHEAEKSAFKKSGTGTSRMGANAIKRFLQQKAYIIKDHNTTSPWW